MKTLYMRQKVFSWKDNFTVRGEDGSDCYRVEGEFLSWGKKLHVYDMPGNEVAFIRQKVMSWRPRFYVFVNGIQVAEVVREFALRPCYTIHGLGWDMKWTNRRSRSLFMRNVCCTRGASGTKLRHAFSVLSSSWW